MIMMKPTKTKNYYASHSSPTLNANSSIIIFSIHLKARQVKKCMNEKDDCLSYEILKREAAATLDDSPRMIVNPEFVEGLDETDGAEQFTPEDQKKFDEAMGEGEDEEESVEEKAKP